MTNLQRVDIEDFGTCDKCGTGRMVKKFSSKNNQHFLSCNQYPRCKNAKPFRVNASSTSITSTVEVKDEITNLFKINLSPFPRNLYILSEALKSEFPEAAYYDRTNLVTIRHDARLRELPFDDEKVKQILYRYIRHKFSQHSGFAVLSKKFSEDKVNEVILPDTSHPSLGNSYLEYLQICQAFRFAIHYSEGQFYLSVEPTLRVMNQMSASTFGQLFEVCRK